MFLFYFKQFPFVSKIPQSRSYLFPPHDNIVQEKMKTVTIYFSQIYSRFIIIFNDFP